MEGRVCFLDSPGGQHPERNPTGAICILSRRHRTGCHAPADSHLRPSSSRAPPGLRHRTNAPSGAGGLVTTLAVWWGTPVGSGTPGGRILALTH